MGTSARQPASNPLHEVWQTPSIQSIYPHLTILLCDPGKLANGRSGTRFRLRHAETQHPIHACGSQWQSLDISNGPVNQIRAALPSLNYRGDRVVETDNRQIPRRQQARIGARPGPRIEPHSTRHISPPNTLKSSDARVEAGPFQ